MHETPGSKDCSIFPNTCNLRFLILLQLRRMCFQDYFLSWARQRTLTCLQTPASLCSMFGENLKKRAHNGTWRFAFLPWILCNTPPPRRICTKNFILFRFSVVSVSWYWEVLWLQRPTRGQGRVCVPAQWQKPSRGQIHPARSASELQLKETFEWEVKCPC